MKKITPTTKLKAFTLQELLVVLTIIGILVLLAVPAFNAIFGKAYQTEAKLQLKHLYELQHVHHKMNFVYAEDFNTIGFESPTTMFEGGEARYTYEIIKADRNDFIARAEAIEDFDGDGEKNVLEVTKEGKVREVIPD